MRMSLLMLAVLVPAAVCAAAGDVPLFSWENDFEGWDLVTNTDGYFFVTDIGVTDGDYAVAIDVQPGWTQGLTHGFAWQSFFPMMEQPGATKLKIDVTTSNELANVPMGSGIQLALFFQGQPGGGAPMFNYTYSYELIMPVYSQTVQTQTLEFDLTIDIDDKGNPVLPLPHFDNFTGGWCEMRLHTNVLSGAPDPGLIIIDNLRVEREDIPTTGLGDYTGDFVVDTADYTMWADHFGQDDTVVLPLGSCNGDGIVDTAEYTIWADHFGATYGTPTPEPSVLCLLAAGLTGLLKCRRKDRAFTRC